MNEDHRTEEIRRYSIQIGETGQRLVDFIKAVHPRFKWGDDDPLELVNYAMRPADLTCDVIELPDDGPTEPPRFRVIG
ncbi:MAG: hypothetical protein ACM3U2_15745 [Deltaproteobacteria bacterium]